MTIRIDSPGFLIDGQPVVASPVDFVQDDGDLRFDRQDRRADETPSSKSTWYWDGFEPRTFLFSARIAETRRPEEGRYEVVAMLQRAARETEGSGPDERPAYHMIQGPIAEALGLDSPVIWHKLRVEDDDEDDSISISIPMTEIDTDRIVITSRPPPQSDPVDDDTDPIDPLDTDDRELERELASTIG